jgi:hypothetical protein
MDTLHEHPDTFLRTPSALACTLAILLLDREVLQTSTHHPTRKTKEMRDCVYLVLKEVFCSLLMQYAFKIRF